MTRLEERLLEASPDKPLIWMRFIDDVFFIWMHGEEELKSFINHLNSSHETIKFTSEQSRDSISFLDVQVSVGEGGVLATDLFCKPTDTHQYLHKKSCHPWHTKKAIPYGQALRFRRICSEDLKDILVRARLSNEGNGGTDKKGCSRCGKSRCQVCNVMSNSEHFHSNIDSREYRINYSFNCDSSNVVYLLECTFCGVQYVGSTCTPFRLRFNNYKACSRKFNSGASVPQVEFFRHFSEEGHHGFLKDISVKIIDRLTGGNRMRESFWQYRLDCFAPKGLNTRQVDT